MVKSCVIDTSKSASAKLTPVPVGSVRLTPDGFWGKYHYATLMRSLPRLFDLFEEKGILDNFRRRSGRKSCDRRGPLFTDSDIYKWMEGVAWALAAADDPAIRDKLETAISEILPAQCPDGYLNTFFTDPNTRFTDPDAHEMYCAGHYVQAAVAIHRCLADDRVLNSAVRFADYLYNQFGPGKPRKWACGHPEIEMALVELYRTTGDRKYLEFARHILDQLNIDAGWNTRWSRNVPLTFARRKELFGHAVRNLYMACAGSDIWAETGDRKIAAAVRRLWDNLVSAKIYITGGVGSRHRHEAIGLNYELPNLLAYTETCAAIANVFWNYRNLSITAEGQFADWMERSLYNGVISGISLDYARYFYENPLASLGDRERLEWYDCTCCPSNMVRLLGSIGGYFYSTDRHGIWVHLYDANTAVIDLDGEPVTITQQTTYPADANVRIAVEPEHKRKFTLNLRIPNWAGTATVKINGKPVGTKPRRHGYLAITRLWQPGDTVELDLSMPVRMLAARPDVADNYHRAALMRGPLVYCLESVDNRALPSIFHGALKPGSTARIRAARGLPKTIRALEVKGAVLPDPKALYEEYHAPKARSATLTAIPYYAWANRGKSQMTVWIPVI